MTQKLLTKPFVLLRLLGEIKDPGSKNSSPDQKCQNLLNATVNCIKLCLEDATSNFKKAQSINPAFTKSIKNLELTDSLKSQLPTG